MIFVVLYNEPRTLPLPLSYIPSSSLIYIFTLRQSLTKLNFYVAQAGLRLVRVRACVSECMSFTHSFYFYAPYTCRSLQRPEEDNIKSPGIEITGGCELPYGCWKPNLGLVNKLPLTDEPSLHPMAFLSFCLCLLGGWDTG